MLFIALRVSIDWARVVLGIASVANAVTFRAAALRTYTVQYKPSLEESAWLKLVDVLARTTNRTETIVDPAPGAASRYYRLATPVQP